MKPQSADKETLAFYNGTARKYSQDTAPCELPVRLVDFANDLPGGNHVLDLGCGGGWAAKAFCDLGFQATAMDPSHAMIAEAANIPGIKTVLGGCDDLKVEDTYSGIWASFSLQHSKRSNMPRVLGNISRALRVGGRLYIGIHEGNQTMRDKLGRLYCHYTEDELGLLLNRSNLSILSVSRDKSTGYDGRDIDCLHIVAAKNG